MTDDEFWFRIEQARAVANDDVERQVELIAAGLANDGISEMRSFGRFARQEMLDANLTDLLHAVRWIFAANGIPEVSGDSWEYARGWLVTRGRRDYDAACTQPDLLAQLFTDIEAMFEGEDIEYAHCRAYELATGDRECPQDFYDPCVIETWPEYPLDEEINPEELASRFPRLRARFGAPIFLDSSQRGDNNR